MAENEKETGGRGKQRQRPVRNRTGGRGKQRQRP